MTANFVAQIRAFNEKATRNVGLVVLGAIQDVAELMSVPRDGIVRGAPFQEGVVPVDMGQLISSLVVDINGGVTGQGAGEQPPDYSAALVGFEIGDTVTVAFTAPYARVIEYGKGAVPGRFSTRNAVQQWQTIADENARVVGAS